MTVPLSSGHDGMIEGLWFTGNYVFMIIIVLVNIKLLVDTNTHTVLTVVIIVGSICSAYLFFYIFQAFTIFSVYNQLLRMFNNYTIWFLSVILVSASLLGEMVLANVRELIMNYYKFMHDAIKRPKKVPIPTLDAPGYHRMSTYIYIYIY